MERKTESETGDKIIYKAAVIGLGNIGFKFDLDPKRKETWSHAAAFERCRKTILSGAVEVNEANADLFRKYYCNTPVFNSIKEMMENISVDIVSISTPTETHYYIVKELIQYPIKAIFCEKPISLKKTEARMMVSSCKKAKILLAVNHTRRWDSTFLLAKKMVREGKIGEVKAASIYYPDHIFNVGTHLFDVICMLIDKKPKYVSGVGNNLSISDPGISGWILFEDNVLCTVNATGKREDLIFELDIIGSEGRLKVLENGQVLEYYIFEESPRYSGYRELILGKTETIIPTDRFVTAIEDIVAVLEGKKPEVNCTGMDGFFSVSLAISLVRSAKKQGIPLKLSPLRN
jgi:predicted dehydrogenase